MAEYSNIVILITSVLVAVGFGFMILLGIRNLFNGKHSLRSVLSFVVPLAVFGICYLLADSLNEAAILTVIALVAISIVGVIASGLKSLFN